MVKQGGTEMPAQDHMELSQLITTCRILEMSALAVLGNLPINSVRKSLIELHRHTYVCAIIENNIIDLNKL